MPVDKSMLKSELPMVLIVILFVFIFVAIFYPSWDLLAFILFILVFSPLVLLLDSILSLSLYNKPFEPLLRQIQASYGGQFFEEGLLPFMIKNSIGYVARMSTSIIYNGLPYLIEDFRFTNRRADLSLRISTPISFPCWLAIGSTREGIEPVASALFSIQKAFGYPGTKHGKFLIGSDNLESAKKFCDRNNKELSKLFDSLDNPGYIQIKDSRISLFIVSYARRGVDIAKVTPQKVTELLDLITEIAKREKTEPKQRAITF